MQKKLPLKDVLAAIDLNAKDVWDELSDEERKQVSFYLLNRYVSSVKSTREKAELAVFKTNEYYNKGFFVFCLLYTSPSPRDSFRSRMPSSA